MWRRAWRQREATFVEQAEYIFRGYEDICRDLSSLGGRLVVSGISGMKQFRQEVQI